MLKGAFSNNTLTLNRQVGNINIGGFSSGGAQSVDVSMNGSTLTVTVDGHSDSVSLGGLSNPLTGTLTIDAYIRAYNLYNFTYSLSNGVNGAINNPAFGYNLDSSSLNSDSVLVKYRPLTSLSDSYSNQTWLYNRCTSINEKGQVDMTVEFEGNNTGNIILDAYAYPTTAYGLSADNYTNFKTTILITIRIVNGSVYSTTYSNASDASGGNLDQLYCYNYAHEDTYVAGMCGIEGINSIQYG